MFFITTEEEKDTSVCALLGPPLRGLRSDKAVIEAQNFSSVSLSLILIQQEKPTINTTSKEQKRSRLGLGPCQPGTADKCSGPENSGATGRRGEQILLYVFLSCQRLLFIYFNGDFILRFVVWVYEISANVSNKATSGVKELTGSPILEEFRVSLEYLIIYIL